MSSKSASRPWIRSSTVDFWSVFVREIWRLVCLLCRLPQNGLPLPVCSFDCASSLWSVSFVFPAFHERALPPSPPERTEPTRVHDLQKRLNENATYLVGAPHISHPGLTPPQTCLIVYSSLFRPCSRRTWLVRSLPDAWWLQIRQCVSFCVMMSLRGVLINIPAKKNCTKKGPVPKNRPFWRLSVQVR